jgi:hypothetical protein
VITWQPRESGGSSITRCSLHTWYGVRVGCVEAPHRATAGRIRGDVAAVAVAAAYHSVGCVVACVSAAVTH